MERQGPAVSVRFKEVSVKRVHFREPAKRVMKAGTKILDVSKVFVKGPCSHKRLCAFVFLFSNDSFAKCSVFIGFHF